jgi:hypothetical protein
MNQTMTEQISPNDWNATPPAVQRILLALQREMETIRARVERLEHHHDAPHPLLERYHALIELQFSHGLTPEQQQEIERLGKEIDEANSSFYPSLDSLAETITAQTGQQPK